MDTGYLEYLIVLLTDIRCIKYPKHVSGQPKSFNKSSIDRRGFIDILYMEELLLVFNSERIFTGFICIEVALKVFYA